jgi:hypothetical protein
MTLETLERILYDLTYENGLTFGMCGTATAGQRAMLVDAINAHESHNRPREIFISKTSKPLDCYGPPLDGRGKGELR